MQNTAISKRSAIGGIFLVIPGALLITLLTMGIDPPLPDFLRPYIIPSEGPHVVGSLIAFNFIVVFPLAALILNLGVLQSTLTNRRLSNLVTIAFAVIVVLVFAAQIAIDQFPCLIGVPNCD